VTHFVDTLPLDFSRPEVQELRNLLADNYYRDAQVEQLVRDAGIPPAAIPWDRPMLLVWDNVLDTARKQGRLRTLLERIAAGPDAAIGTRVRELLGAQPVLEAPSPDTDPDWKNFSAGSLERIIQAESTLLDVAFLQRGSQLAAAVARLLVTLNGQKIYGTGFRIGPDLLLTNHHVLISKAGVPATAVEAWFGYEQTFDGAHLEYAVVAGRPDTIIGRLDHDWAVIRVDAFPDGTPTIALTGAKPVDVDDRVYIVQHPNGGVKKIGMIHNVVRYTDDNVVQYWTDTEGGSSGSPVFNESWELVALHHKYVRVPSQGRKEYRNQGQRIERVVEGLMTAGVL
jgi:endonuclease G